MKENLNFTILKLHNSLNFYDKTSIIMLLIRVKFLPTYERSEGGMGMEISNLFFFCHEPNRVSTLCVIKRQKKI